MAAQERSGKEARRAPSRDPVNVPVGIRKVAALVGGILLLGLFAFLSWRQPQPGQFEPTGPRFHWKWWWTPIEVNAENRLPPTTNNLQSIVAVPDSKGQVLFAVGLGGTILHTDDGGGSWKPQASGTSQDLNSVTFATARSGWAVGRVGTILHTDDGGVSWKPQGSGTSQDLNGVGFATAQSGWAVGRAGTILHTDDGGKSWMPQATGTIEYLTSVTFATAQSGWAVGYGGAILHTDDGGKSWMPQASGTSQDLNNVTFATAQSGWAVGYGGTILHTDNGGKSWMPQASGTRQDLPSVTFATTQSGWALGEGGTILHTDDGGKSWKPQAIGMSPYLLGVTFVTAQSGWAVGLGGTILHTDDGGGSWMPQASGRSQYLTSVTFATAQSGWVVGLDGAILHTDDGGVSWKPQVSGTRQDLTSVTFATAQSGWAVGYGGTILHTDDGGVSWKPQAGGTRQDLTSVTFATTQLGWALGQGGTILHTDDGGVSWKPQASGTRQDLTSVTFATAQSGWALVQGGTILHTDDGGKSWKPQASGTSPYLFGVAFATAQSGWAVGPGGTILQTDDGGVSWKPQGSGTSQDLNGVGFATAQSGWAVGRAGTILHTDDGGKSWKPQASGTSQDLTSVTFATAQSGWAVGDGRAILHTDDGGKSWMPQEAFPYRRYPAPWLYVAICAVLPLLMWALIPAWIVNSTSIEEIVASDSPVTSVKDDRLGQRALVERLSRFLRNPKTFPPLVISLQARWGMGKSSVMRMLESDLKENRAAVTVWFNAWHHQREDQLLAYLLETIQKEAVPSWLSPVGMSFRFNLARIRLFATIDRLVLTVVAVAFLTLRILRPEIFEQDGWKKWVIRVGVAGALVSLLQILIAFKSNPEKLADNAGGFLVDTLKELVRLPSLVGKSDVRQEFANNLKDVVEALSPQRLVIFLDDLDRCKPEQVVQILEAINFLSSVASCVVIVGADYEKVETLVAMQFEPIALRESENTGGPSVADPVALRVEYARNYLKKIVNLRLNLRLPTASDYALMLQDRPIERLTPNLWIGRVGVVFALLLPILGTISVAHWMKPAPANVTTTASNLQPIGRAATRGGSAANPTQEQAPSAGSTQRKTPTAVASVPVREDGRLMRNLLSPGLPALLGSFFLVYWFSRPRRVEETEDAETFAEALQARSTEIFRKCKSPREVRRFLNYLRLIATEPMEKYGTGEESLRQRYPQWFDTDLVDLASMGPMNRSGPGGTEIRDYFMTQCEIFGLDPETFMPVETPLRTASSTLVSNRMHTDL